MQRETTHSRPPLPAVSALVAEDLVLADDQGVDARGQFQEVAGHGLALDDRKPMPAHLPKERFKAPRVALHQHFDAVAGLEEERAPEPLPCLAEERRFVGEPERLERGDIRGVVADAREREGDGERFRHAGTSRWPLHVPGRSRR